MVLVGICDGLLRETMFYTQSALYPGMLRLPADAVSASTNVWEVRAAPLVVGPPASHYGIANAAAAFPSSQPHASPSPRSPEGPTEKTSPEYSENSA